MRRVARQLTSMSVYSVGPAVSSPARIVVTADLSAVPDGLQQRRLWLPAPTEPGPAHRTCTESSELHTARSAAGSPDRQPASPLRATPKPFYDAQHPFAPNPLSLGQRQGRARASQPGTRGYGTSWQAEQDAQEVQKLLRLLQDIPHHR